MKIVYMGTPDFAVGPLAAIAEAGYEIGYAVTQQDKARNRGKKIQFTPVKTKAMELDIPVLQPERVKGDEEFLKTLEEYAPDVIVVAAYGQILPEEVLTLPKYGCINIHASLLPRHRSRAWLLPRLSSSCRRSKGFDKNLTPQSVYGRKSYRI